jgi:vancomycin resistance protein YoaR
VKKLHGVLIKPGEIFSTLEHLEPFTLDAGYVPELVIKGTQLKPEIGGGLCQIGTTLFRMAMEGGMPIVERRNHSLVVQYYGDLRNGNPGTDATIFDPWPDFKFTNDTGHHVLIQTDMDEKTGELAFTLWGTSDGREASYSAPTVKRWIPHGETKFIETDKLPPGEQKCQHAFPGAEASFTYTRKLPDGTTEDRVFESYYRPLPEICLVGVAASTTNQDLGSIELNY